VQDQTVFLTWISHCLIACRDKWQRGLWASMPQSNILVSKMRYYKSSMVRNSYITFFIEFVGEKWKEEARR
jgi:hypothetical protein